MGTTCCVQIPTKAIAFIFAQIPFEMYESLFSHQNYKLITGQTDLSCLGWQPMLEGQLRTSWAE